MLCEQKALSPRGRPGDHYPTKEAARAGFERKHEKQASPSFKKSTSQAPASKPNSPFEGPTPLSIHISIPSYQENVLQCSLCKSTDPSLRYESEREGLEGYSPCCNEGMDLVPQMTEPVYESKWASAKDMEEFITANGMQNYYINEQQGELKLVGAIPGKRSR